MTQRLALRTTLALLAFLAVGCIGRIGGEASARYFTSAALSKDPALPVGEISRAEADAIETQGGSYFVAAFGDDGSLATLERRTRGSLEYRIEYTYSGGRVVSKKTTGADGTTSEESL